MTKETEIVLLILLTYGVFYVTDSSHLVRDCPALMLERQKPYSGTTFKVQ